MQYSQREAGCAIAFSLSLAPAEHTVAAQLAHPSVESSASHHRQRWRVQEQNLTGGPDWVTGKAGESVLERADKSPHRYPSATQ